MGRVNRDEAATHLAGVADLLNEISMSDDLESQGPAINALALQLRAHRCSPVDES